jgi:hypothetical protein
MPAKVSADVVVPCRAQPARGRLDALLGGPGAGAVVRVGPRRRRWPRRAVRAVLNERRDGARTSVTPLRWAPLGPFERMLPTLRADVAVTAIDDTSCLLTVAGCYDPPMGRLGRVADRAMLHRLAVSTTTDFATRLAAAIATGRDASPSLLDHRQSGR